MITGRQIRAARGLLKWSSPDLAKKAGLTRETINKIEGDVIQPREGTLNDIIGAFDQHGVEFIDTTGVRIKPQGLEVLLGQSGLQQFFNEVYAYARDHGGNTALLYAARAGRAAIPTVSCVASRISAKVTTVCGETAF